MLSDLKIRPGYTTDIHNISEEFYNPCLSEAIRYDRVAGYFSSSSLRYLTKGIESLISKQGKYRLMISKEISIQDYDAIKKGYHYRQKLAELVDQELNFNQFEGLTNQQKLANLAYLISIGLIDIKIGFYHTGLFHAKYGIITDEEDNQVYFSGSANETANAIEYNFENIDIKKSWLDETEKEYIKNKESEFNDIWDGKNKFVFVSEVNDNLKFKLTQYNKGELIIDKQYFEKNALVLVYKQNHLEIINNLDEDIVHSRSFKRLSRKYNISRNNLVFDKSINYKQVEEIIKILEKHEVYQGQKIIIAESVYNFIETCKFEIDEVAKRGLLIKNQDESFIPDVQKFNEIVNEEFAEGMSLRGVQKWVSYFMTRMVRAANFSVPGSGKTPMVYGAFAYLSSSQINEVDQVVMIGPKNSFFAWKNEFKKFFNDKRPLHVLDIHDPSFDEVQLVRSPRSYNLILINYESLPQYTHRLENFVDSRTLLVFDEVHKIKNTKSIRAQHAINLAKLTKYRFVLTGTPIPNTYLDVWNFLHILYHDEYQSYFGLSKNELSKVDLVTQEKINDKLSPFFWRVTKDDLGVPPPEDDYIYSLCASNQEQEIIDLLWRKYRHSPFKLYIRLIQLSSNPQLLARNIEKSMFLDLYANHDDEDNKDDLMFEYEDEMAEDIIKTYSNYELELLKNLETTRKFEAAINKIEELVNQDKKVIVWCIFVDTIDKVVQRCEALNFRVKFINGSVPSHEREVIIKEFQEGKFDVLVTNPHTLAESVSLHMVCHDAIYLEYSFNLTHMLQSRDRIHRLGLKQDDVTSYYYFMLEGQKGERNTIDEKIYDRLKDKEEVMINAIEGELLVPEITFDEKEEILDMMYEEMIKRG